MGTALIKIKIMPNSPDADLEIIKNQAKKIILEKQGQNPKTETQSIAFGLNAVIITFALDESKSVDEIQNQLKKIENTSSAEVIDFRRAFG